MRRFPPPDRPRTLPGESEFLGEWFAHGAHPGKIPISTVCNVACLYCCNTSNPFPSLEGRFRDVEDIKVQLNLMPPHDLPIAINDTVCVRLAEGESLIHPRIFDILALVRRRYPTNRLCFVSNGSMLDDAFVAQLARFNPTYVSLSLHSADPELWSHIYGASLKKARIAIDAMDVMGRHGVAYAASLITMPRICGWDDIERTYDFIAARDPEHITLSIPARTRQMPPAIYEQLDCDEDEYRAFVARVKGRARVPVETRIDFTWPDHVQVPRILDATHDAVPRPRKVLWLASEAAAPRLGPMVRRAAAGLPVRHELVAVRNETYGGNIVVAGHLLVDDFIAAGARALEDHPDVDLVLVPRVPFDSLFRDMARRPAFHIAEALGRPVWVTGNDGVAYPMLAELG